MFMFSVGKYIIIPSNVNKHYCHVLVFTTKSHITIMLMFSLRDTIAIVASMFSEEECLQNVNNLVAILTLCHPFM